MIFHIQYVFLCKLQLTTSKVRNLGHSHMITQTFMVASKI